MALMFSNATSFNGDLKHWNVSQVLNMQSMFENATSFKGDLSRWDTSNVVNTVKMFQGAVSFDSDLSYWDTQFLVHRRDMFTDATSFNGALSTRNASALQRDEWNTEGREFRKQAQTAAGRGSFVVRVTSEEQARVLLWSQAWNTFYDTRLAATRTLLDRLRGEGRLCVGEPDLSGIPFPENTEELRRMGVVFRLDSGQCISRYDVQLLLDRDDARVDKVLAPYGTSPAPVKRLTDVEKVGIGFLWAMSYSDNGAMKGEWPSEDDMTPPMDGWPDLVSMANDEKYVAQWYRLHETLRFQPFPDGDEREKPTQQELNERRQWTRTKETAQNRLRQEVTNIVRHSERQAQLLKMQQEKGILYQPSFRLPTPPLKITELVVPPTPKRPRPITATELTASLLQEQEDDASLRGNAVNQAVLTQINSNRTTYTLRIEHFGQTPQPEAEGEIVLRFASKPFRTAVNAMFGVPYSVEGRTKHCVSEEVKSGGDFVNANVVYKPIAIYEILNTMASSEYRQEMRKTRFANCSYRQEPVTCLTDSKFTGLMSESQGGAIDSSAPVNDKVLLHATSPSSVSSVLLNGLSDQYVAKFGSRYGKGIYFADVVCKNVRYSQPSTTRTDIDQLLNLTSSESARVRYMFVYRVTLGCAARYDQNMLSQQWESFRSTGVDRQPIYRPSTNGNEWNPPFTSLVINSYQNPQEHIMKNRDAARMLPVGLVAYEKTYVTSERAMGRVDRWW
jgi:surface protein